MEKEKEVKRLVKYISDCIAAGKSPILASREVKLLQANKDLIENQESPKILYFL